MVGHPNPARVTPVTAVMLQFPRRSRQRPTLGGSPSNPLCRTPKVVVDSHGSTPSWKVEPVSSPAIVLVASAWFLAAGVAAYRAVVAWFVLAVRRIHPILVPIRVSVRANDAGGAPSTLRAMHSTHWSSLTGRSVRVIQLGCVSPRPSAVEAGQSERFGSRDMNGCVTRL